MSFRVNSSPAVVCTQCSKLMDSPLCCASCGALNPLPQDQQSFNYFDMFGLPAGFDLDTATLHRRFLALSRWIHPDVRVDRSDAARLQALALSAELNRAYETLRDPVSRAEYLLALAGGPSPTENQGVFSQLLSEIMMLREEIEELAHGRDTQAIEALGGQIAGRHQATLDEIARLCRGLEASPAGGAVRSALREHLNAIKYWVNLREQLSAAAHKQYP